MELAGSNVLGYQLADGTTLVVRPGHRTQDQSHVFGLRHRQR